MCDYPEGHCACGPEVTCHGGAAVRTVKEPPRPPVMMWQCTTTPPAVRTDGCPGKVTDGGACTTENQKCDYPSSCFAGETAICTAGRWLVEQWPPPP